MQQGGGQPCELTSVQMKTGSNSEMTFRIAYAFSEPHLEMLSFSLTLLLELPGHLENEACLCWIACLSYFGPAQWPQVGMQGENIQFSTHMTQTKKLQLQVCQVRKGNTIFWWSDSYLAQNILMWLVKCEIWEHFFVPKSQSHQHFPQTSKRNNWLQSQCVQCSSYGSNPRSVEGEQILKLCYNSWLKPDLKDLLGQEDGNTPSFGRLGYDSPCAI